MKKIINVLIIAVCCVQCTLDGSIDVGTFYRQITFKVSPPKYRITVNKVWEREDVAGSGEITIADATNGTYNYRIIKEGYETLEGQITIDKDQKSVILNLALQIKYYTVTFKDYNDRVITSYRVEHGKTVQAPKTPSVPDGFVFDGWDKSFDEITSDLEVKMKIRAAN